MTSDRKIMTNRRNAARSTGPKSSSGKARSSRNALRHGLATRIAHVPGKSKDIERLAFALAGTSDPDLFCYAQAAAEAELEILRVREARIVSLNQITDRISELQAEKFTREISDSQAHSFPKIARRLNMAYEFLSAHSAAEFTKIASNLAAFDRYEYRASLRRKRALRDLDAARNQKFSVAGRSRKTIQSART